MKNEILTLENTKEIGEKVLLFINNYVIPTIIHIKDYVVDLAILDDGTIYFIELNSFGAQYAAGSALFHWKKDSEILLNNKIDIEFRYTA